MQVVDDADRDGLVADASVAQDKVAGAVAERVPGGLGGLGLAATSLAVAGLTAGGAAMPATALLLFTSLLGGVALMTVHVFRV